MAIFLDHISSLKFIHVLRAAHADSSLRVGDHEVRPVPALRSCGGACLAASHVPSDEEVSRFTELLPEALAGALCSCFPATVVVDKPPKRRHGGSAVAGCRVWSEPVPEGAFLEVFPGLWICSVEYALARAAAHISLGDWLLEAMALCGVYEVDSGDDGLVRTRPTTSMLLIGEACECYGGTKGMKHARRWSRFLMDGSASPQETRSSLLLTLPMRMGGYGLIRPLLNTGLGAWARSGGAVRGDADGEFPDLSWPDRGVVLEYVSDDWHTGADAIARDARRSNKLVVQGVTVLSLTNAQLGSISDTDQIARDLARVLGIRLRNRDFSPQWRQRNLQLRSDLGLRVDRSDFDGWTLVEQPAMP